MLNSLISITITDKEKKVLLILLLILFLVVLFLGIINRLIAKDFARQGKKIDKYLSGYVRYKFVNNKKEFAEVGADKNNILFLKQSSIGLLLIILSLTELIIYCSVTKTDWYYIFTMYYDALIKFKFETTKIFNITVISSWPTIAEGSFVFHATLEGFIAYSFGLMYLVGGIWYIKAIFNRMARAHRIKEKSKEIFETSLDQYKAE